MQLSRGQLVTATLSGLLAAFGFWSFAITLSPIPQPLLTEAGVIASAEARRPRGKLAVIWIRVAPGGREFGYPDILGNAEGVWGKIASGLPVEIQYTNPQDPELWGLKVAGEPLITPEAAHRARRENGLWGLGIGVAFLGCLLYTLLVEGRRQAA